MGWVQRPPDPGGTVSLHAVGVLGVRCQDFGLGQCWGLDGAALLEAADCSPWCRGPAPRATSFPLRCSITLHILIFSPFTP